MVRFGASSWGLKWAKRLCKWAENSVDFGTNEKLDFQHPYQGFACFGASNLGSETALDGSEFALGAVLNIIANLEPVRSRFGSV